LEELGVRTWAMSAAQLRLLYHAFRGETEEVQRYRDLVELFAVQGNTTWQVEMFLPAVLLHADVLSGDTIGVRRCWEQLARKAKSLPVLSVYADFAHAAYLALRGELSAAIELYEKVLPQLPPQRRKNWLSARAYFADVLNHAGQHARAKQVATEALSHLHGEEHAVLVFTLEPRRQLALAEAGLGNHAEAVRLLDAALADHGQHDNPMLVGLLHKARAEVALAMGEKQAFEQHLAEMEQRFRGTRNPALIAQCDRIAERARRVGVRTSLQPVSHSQPAALGRATGLSIEQTLAELTAAADRSEYALKLVMQHTHAKVGYLYLLEDDALRLAAASHPHEPPAVLEARLKEQALRAEMESLEDDQVTRVDLASFAHTSPPGVDQSGQRTIIIESAHPQASLDNYRTVVLSTLVQGRRIAVGGLVLEIETLITFRLEQNLIEGVAKGLYERGMTTTINSQIQ
jgi:tetratricopeptide (TPR) repeat protein